MKPSLSGKSPIEHSCRAHRGIYSHTTEETHVIRTGFLLLVHSFWDFIKFQTCSPQWRNLDLFAISKYVCWKQTTCRSWYIVQIMFWEHDLSISWAWWLLPSPTCMSFFKPQLWCNRSRTCSTCKLWMAVEVQLTRPLLCSCACARLQVCACTCKNLFFCLCEREREGKKSDQAGGGGERIQQWKVFEFYFTCAPTHIVLQTLQGKLSLLNLVRATICLYNPWQNNRLMWSNSISLFPGYETSCLTQIPTQQFLSHSAPFLELDIKE